MRRRQLLCQQIRTVVSRLAGPVLFLLAESTGFAQPQSATPDPVQAPEPVQAPVVLTHVDAVYPPSALVERKHGDVVLTVTVDTDGHVSAAQVVESGGSELDEAAIIAIRQW